MLACAAVLALAVLAGPALATESGGVEGGEEGGSTKIQLPTHPRDQVALLLTGAMLLGGGLALYNAHRRLRGEGERASGRWRYR